MRTATKNQSSHYVRAIALALVPVFLLTTGCKELQSQKARESFENGKMPLPLFRAANQIHELGDIDKIIARVAADKQNPLVFNVAVIDNGMDLAHPDLQSKIAFDVENGKLVGAGFDFMGDDRWPSHNLIDPSLYAFDAEAIRDGKIVTPSARPMEKLAELNDSFMGELSEAIKADPILSKSLFAKISKTSASLYGLNFFALSEFDKGKYNSAKRDGTLLTGASSSTQDKDQNGKEIPLERRVRIHFTVESAWVLGDSGIPVAIRQTRSSDTSGTFDEIEGAYRFRDLINEKLSSFKQSAEYKKALATFSDYRKSRKYDPSKSDDDNTSQTLDTLARDHFFKVFGPSSQDPLRQLSGLINQLVVAEKLARGEKLGPDFQPNAADVKAAFARSNARVEELIAAISAAPSASAEEAQTLRQLREKEGMLREFSDWILRERVWEKSNLAELTSALPQNSLYRRYLLRTGHPFYAEQSAETVHASHVAGIISMQDPNIRIVPVRVTTQGVLTSPSEARALKAQFIAGMRSFLAEPLVFKAFGAKFGTLVPAANFADGSVANRAGVAKIIVDQLQEQIDIAFEKGFTDFAFMDEVKKAITYVGQRKIKIANISLGMKFDAPIASSVVDQAKQLPSLFKFLEFEYFKFDMAGEIERSAKGTLFVIAAGNDSSWVDGRSRSALPVDLSSPFLEEFERPAKVGQEALYAPNNHLTNILGVGSIGPDNHLSSFTNLLLSMKTPFILANGENILSPVKSTSSQGVDQAFDRYLPELSDLRKLSKVTDDARLKKFFDDHATDGGAFAYGQSVSLLSATIDASKLHMMLRYPDHRARLSGTSMASPTTAGLIAHMAIEKAERLHISPEEAYLRPELAPEVLIKDAFKRASPLKLSMGITLSALLGDKKWSATPQSQAIEKLLSDMTTRGAANNHLTVLAAPGAAASTH